MSLATGNNAIDALVYGSWNSTAQTPVTLTYGFLTRAPAGASADDRNGFQPMSTAQQAAVREAMGIWASVADITFVEVAADSGNLRFGTNEQDGSSGYAYLPKAGVSMLSMYLDHTSAYNSIFTPGTYGPWVVLHEIGHLLGLKHPGDYDSAGNGVAGPFLPRATDNNDYTQMSYNDPSSYAINRSYATTAMLYDIQAIQYLYGANMRHRAGDDSYVASNATAPLCIWDAGGTDTVDFAACTGPSVINLNAGAFSETARGLNNVSIAYNVTIENAIGGAGGTTFYANSAGNHLAGGIGVDTFHQGAGSDTIAGGAGQDTVVFANDYAAYRVLREGDTLTVTGEGADILSGIEYLRFADRTLGIDAFGAGVTDGNDIIIAPSGSARIDGGGGRDMVIFAGARAGYQVQADGDGYTVTGTASGTVDVVVDVERVQFADASVALDVDGAPGQLYRLYEAAFGRAPDQAGLGFWLAGADNGLALGNVAQAFAQSPEFGALYGTLDNAGFLTRLYINVLDREYDAAGYAYWLEVLDRGAARGDVLTGFSESAEFRATLVGAISDGIDYLPYA
ncbi:DUF4214 domain-containing protein [Pseudoduganella lutea]|uniref:DUF4214 domain-containing protein n=1 Tax=Pseudoduganella lutea TaxID=321985 RepID=A0A4P6L4B0_9BURK|nr:DUF4214 domain-containing protein [Pseudoduganella lutea]QBE66264.1 DUF4214 domain-containing protein [Pseudoduganella lutea]